MIGGGPAGSAAAATLARDGRSVLLLVEPRPARTRGVGEGAPPGLDRAVDDVFGPGTFVPDDHLRSLGNRAAWGGDELLATDFMFNPFGCGWHLDRVAFDDRLLAAAAAAGATVAPAHGRAHRRAGRDRRHRSPRRARPSPRRATRRRRPAHRGGRDVRATSAATPRRPSRRPPTAGGTRARSRAGGGSSPSSPTATYSTRRCGRGAASTPAPAHGAHRRPPRRRPPDRAARRAPPARPTSIRPSGAGWLAAGDAAASFDPLSSQGILTAVLMGREAARHVDDPAAHAARYRRDRRRLRARTAGDVPARGALADGAVLGPPSHRRLISGSAPRRLATSSWMRAASSGRTLRSWRRYSAIVGTMAMASARPQASTKRSINRPRTSFGDGGDGDAAVDGARGPDDPRLGDVGGGRADRGVGPVEHHRPVGRQHDVVGVEVEVEDRLRRPEAGRHATIDEVADRHRGQPAVQLGPQLGVAPAGATAVARGRSASCARRGAASRGRRRLRRAPPAPGTRGRRGGASPAPPARRGRRARPPGGSAAAPARRRGRRRRPNGRGRAAARGQPP